EVLRCGFAERRALDPRRWRADPEPLLEGISALGRGGPVVRLQALPDALPLLALDEHALVDDDRALLHQVAAAGTLRLRLHRCPSSSLSRRRSLTLIDLSVELHRFCCRSVQATGRGGCTCSLRLANLPSKATRA